MLEFSVKKLHFMNYFIVALVFLASLLLVRTLSGIFLSNQKPQIVTSGEMTTKNPAPQLKNITSYSAILEKNPFGSPKKLQPLTVMQGTESKQGPPSNLLLVGTVVGPTKLSYAIFEDKTRPAPLKQVVVAYEKNVFDYGKLIKIERDFIELRQGSSVYKISLAPLISDTRSPRAEESGSPRTSFAEKIGEKEYLLNRRKVDQTLENPEHILTDARLLPNIQNGKQEGFKMLEVKSGGLYESLGLKNGDILLRVNDLEISNPEVAIQAMTALKGMNRVNLDIMRNGAKLSMSYDIK
ncbi:MAG: gspC [Nitrospirae bacterium]|nr:gspC [Nitrospirota bacterium]